MGLCYCGWYGLAGMLGTGKPLDFGRVRILVGLLLMGGFLRIWWFALLSGVEIDRVFGEVRGGFGSFGEV